jgi:hypothetical protein
LGKLGRLVDLLGGGEEIEEERNGEEGGEEEAFGLGLERWFRVCWGWGEEVHARVQLGVVSAVGRDVVGGRRPPLSSPAKRPNAWVSRNPRLGLKRPTSWVSRDGGCGSLETHDGGHREGEREREREREEEGRRRTLNNKEERKGERKRD